jgi:hypothetical protein
MVDSKVVFFCPDLGSRPPPVIPTPGTPCRSRLADGKGDGDKTTAARAPAAVLPLFGQPHSPLFTIPSSATPRSVTLLGRHV